MHRLIAVEALEENPVGTREIFDRGHRERVYTPESESQRAAPDPRFKRQRASARAGHPPSNSATYNSRGDGVVFTDDIRRRFLAGTVGPLILASPHLRVAPRSRGKRPHRGALVKAVLKGLPARQIHCRSIRRPTRHNTILILPQSACFRILKADGLTPCPAPEGLRPPRDRERTAPLRRGRCTQALALWEERERRRAEFLLTLDDARASLARCEGRVITQESMQQLASEVKERGRSGLPAELNATC